MIDRAPDGAPAPFVDGRAAEVYLTMTDRADQAVCVVGPPGTRLGCDLELVEPRSDAFVSDYLTPAEQALVRSAATDDGRALLANLVWCGKESSLKVLRTGLRRDTRSVEVSLPAGAPVDGWQPLAVATAEGDVHHGWWQRFGSFVLTVAATEPFAPPLPLVDPPSLATAPPGRGVAEEVARYSSRRNSKRAKLTPVFRPFAPARNSRPHEKRSGAVGCARSLRPRLLSDGEPQRAVAKRRVEMGEAARQREAADVGREVRGLRVEGRRGRLRLRLDRRREERQRHLRQVPRVVGAEERVPGVGHDRDA